MPQKAVADAVEARMQARWSLSPWFGPNVRTTPPDDGSAFIEIQYPASRNDRVAVNEGYYREEGGIRFVMFLDVGEGSKRALEWGDELGKIFRYAEFGGVRTEVPSSPYFDDTNDRSGRMIATVVVPYTFDYQDNGV